MRKIKILFLASDPFRLDQLALNEEIRAITTQIQAAEYRDAIELVSAWAVRPSDLQQLLLFHHPRVMHFSGHGILGKTNGVRSPSDSGTARHLVLGDGGQDSRLIFTGESGGPQPVGRDALVELIGMFRNDIHLVVLNACHTRPQAEAIARVVDCCIGMNTKIGDPAAIAFARAFYRALGSAQDVETAFRLGKNELKLNGIPEDETPELLYLRGAVDPAKVVLVDPTSLSDDRDVGRIMIKQNRDRMIERVRTIWITGFLRNSLLHETRIILGLSARPDAVARPMDVLVRLPDEGEQPLPPGTQVVHVFDSMNHSLLILGAPGAGKTTLLLELARDLLDRAAQDPAHPIPVVFPLTTWAQSRRPLARWLAEELSLRYDIPRKIAEVWVASNQILPLLDGLDEVKAEHRAACVETINAFSTLR